PWPPMRVRSRCRDGAIRPASALPGPGERPRRSGFALGLDQRGRDRFLRRLVGPQDELEDRVEALALLDRGLDQRLRLVQRQQRAIRALEQRRVAEENEAGGGPQFEVAEPELLVDQPDRLVEDGALFGGNADVR